MLYRRLNKTGIDLSILGFGCMRLPVLENKLEKIDYQMSKQLLYHAIEHGVNFIDTAWFYHASVFGQKGESEPFVGEALSGGWREKVHLATKMPLFHMRQKEQMGTYLKEQLERLKTGYLDFYLLHGLNGEIWDRMKGFGVREFLDRKKSEGKIQNACFSFHGDAADFLRICDEYDWTYAQIQFNYMDTEFQAGLKGLEYAASKGINVIVMEPLKGGKLSRNIPPEMMSVFSSFPVKRSPAEWALRYVWNEPGVSALLSGMNAMEQLEENLRVAEEGVTGSLGNDEILIFDALRGAMNNKSKIDCTACRYCMPCKSGVEIPEVLAALNNAVAWNDPNPWGTGYLRVQGKAGKCTECRECEEVCPQGLRVSTHMKEAVALFRE
ncbi:MAG TPA: aldo/keto reductase [Bacteroidales bacterium]|nr:aldo/keto reductase [Bacteroidales bacterium]